jgi:hypothetical protein
MSTPSMAHELFCATALFTDKCIVGLDMKRCEQRQQQANDGNKPWEQ